MVVYGIRMNGLMPYFLRLGVMIIRVGLMKIGMSISTQSRNRGLMEKWEVSKKWSESNFSKDEWIDIWFYRNTWSDYIYFSQYVDQIEDGR